MSHGSVNARCGGIFNNHFTANESSGKKIENRLRFDRNMAMSLGYCFGPTCIYVTVYFFSLEDHR